MALRIETGMTAVEARNAINLIFDFHESRQSANSQKELTRESDQLSDKVHCPECFCTSIERNKPHKKYPYYIHFSNNAKMRAIASAVGLAHTIADRANADNVECICLNCGHKWRVN